MTEEKDFDHGKLPRQADTEEVNERIKYALRQRLFCDLRQIGEIGFGIDIDDRPDRYNRHRLYNTIYADRIDGVKSTKDNGTRFYWLEERGDEARHVFDEYMSITEWCIDNPVPDDIGVTQVQRQVDPDTPQDEDDQQPEYRCPNCEAEQHPGVKTFIVKDDRITCGACTHYGNPEEFEVEA